MKIYRFNPQWRFRTLFSSYNTQKPSKLLKVWGNFYALIFSALTFYTIKQSYTHRVLYETRLLSSLIFGLGQELLLSSAFTHLHLGALQILLLSVTAICHVHHTWPRHPLTLSFEGDMLLSDRWMFFCFAVKTLVNSYSCLITQQGQQRRRAFFTFLQEECSVFSLCFFGDLVTSSCIISWWQTNSSGDSSTGVFWSPKNAGSVWAKVTVMMHRAWTHWINLLMYVGYHGFCGPLSETRLPWLWSKNFCCILIVCEILTVQGGLGNHYQGRQAFLSPHAEAACCSSV